MLRDESAGSIAIKVRVYQSETLCLGIYERSHKSSFVHDRRLEVIIGLISCEA